MHAGRTGWRRPLLLARHGAPHGLVRGAAKVSRGAKAAEVTIRGDDVHALSGRLHDGALRCGFCVRSQRHHRRPGGALRSAQPGTGADFSWPRMLTFTWPRTFNRWRAGATLADLNQRTVEDFADQFRPKKPKQAPYNARNKLVALKSLASYLAERRDWYAKPRYVSVLAGLKLPPIPKLGRRPYGGCGTVHGRADRWRRQVWPA